MGILFEVLRIAVDSKIYCYITIFQLTFNEVQGKFYHIELFFIIQFSADVARHVVPKPTLGAGGWGGEVIGS